MYTLALLMAVARADEPAGQTIVIHLAVPGTRRIEAAEVILTRDGGGEQRLTLLDVPGERGGSPYDGIWSATTTGVPQRYAQLVLSYLPAGGTETVGWSGVVRTDDLPVTSLGFRLADDTRDTAARRAVFALPGHAAEQAAARPVWAGFGWLWAAVFWVGVLLTLRERQRRTPA